MENSNNSLFRSRTDRYLGGVLGGLSQHLNIDSTLLRIIFAVISLFLWQLPLMVFLYVLAWIFMPESKSLEVVEERSADEAEGVSQVKSSVVPWVKILLLAGAGLCVLVFVAFTFIAGGAFVFVKELFDIPYVDMPNFWSNVSLLLFGTIIVLFIPVAALFMMLGKGIKNYDNSLKWVLFIIWIAGIFMVVSSFGNFIECFNASDVEILTT